MKGVIKDPETGKAYKQPDGTYSLGHKVFTTDSDDTGYVSAEVRTPLVLDTTGLDGKNVVVAEYLFEGSDDTDLTINEDGTVDETGVVKTHTGRLVKHDDLTSKSQTLSVPKITKISVKKVWNDADNADGIRPESIKVQLYKNGNTKVYDAVELSEKNNWSYTWEGLPTMENNEDIIYAVDEVEIPAGYEKEVTNKETKFIITNTHVPDVTKISVEKVWDDNNDQDGIRPAAIKVQLYADGKASGRTVELSENNGWKYTWKDLDKQKDGEDIVYTEDEVEVPDGYIKTVTSKGTAFTITNTHTPETTAVKVTKVWKDSNDKYQKRPGSIRVQLYKTVAGELEAVGEPVTLDKSMNWTYTWTDLALQENGITIIYTVDEISVPEGYTKTVTKDADSNITAFIITNSKPDTPKTGDSFRLIPVAVLMAAAFVTGVFVWRKKRKK